MIKIYSFNQSYMPPSGKYNRVPTCFFDLKKRIIPGFQRPLLDVPTTAHSGFPEWTVDPSVVHPSASNFEEAGILPEGLWINGRPALDLLNTTSIKLASKMNYQFIKFGHF